MASSPARSTSDSVARNPRAIVSGRPAASRPARVSMLLSGSAVLRAGAICAIRSLSYASLPVSARYSAFAYSRVPRRSHCGPRLL